MGNPELSLGSEVAVGSGRAVPRVGVRLVEQGMLRVLCGPSGAEGKPLAVGYRAGGSLTVQCW